jgi:hyperosmotically inducible protein
MKAFRFTHLVALAFMALSVTACEKQGPMERAGEEIDEAVDTMKNGGEESAATKADDAMDEVRDGVSDATDEIKND